jgi:hypothetical protein
LYVQWPEAISHRLWPFALLHANFLLNHLPQKDGTTQIGKFANSHQNIDIKDQHTFGCPIYVLQDPLQMAGGKIPKWNSRVQLGIYLGQSPIHSSNIALILNLMTGHVSAQFQVSFYDNFSTIDNICLPSQMTEPRHWKELCTSSVNSIIDEEQCIDNLSPDIQPKGTVQRLLQRNC